MILLIITQYESNDDSIKVFFTPVFFTSGTNLQRIFIFFYVLVLVCLLMLSHQLTATIDNQTSNSLMGLHVYLFVFPVLYVHFFRLSLDMA